MLFTYDKKSLKMKDVKLHQYLILVGIPILIIVSFGYLFGYKSGLDTNIEELSDEEKSILIETIDPFDEQKLVDMMTELGVKFPYIPLAQSKMETGNWKSSLFIENNNLFGMKRATRRVSTAKGTNNGHAYYDTWRESVYDYAFYQCRYLGTVNTESDYFSYLQASYAADSSYVDKLKNMIDGEKLREKFE
jgi:hypothetical protein